MASAHPTLVLKPEEFVKHYHAYLDFNEPGLHIQIPFALLQNGEFEEQQLEGAILRTYDFPFFLLGFFIKLIYLLPDNENQPVILLSRNKPTNGTTYILEIIQLAAEISSLFGEDTQGLGAVREEEFSETDWQGRSWQSGKLKLILLRSNGYFQLYLEPQD